MRKILSDAPYKKKSGKEIRAFLSENVIYLFFIIMFLVCAVSSDYFLKSGNLGNMIRQNASTTVMALGMLLVILTGGIDLSIGGVVALTNVVFAMLLTESQLGLGLAILLTLLCGGVCGAISGYLVSFRKMAPFIATLAMMQITRSLAFVITNAAKIKIVSPTLKSFGEGNLFHSDIRILPNQLLLLILVGGLVVCILKFTSYGRLIYAVGSNESAVILSGVSTKGIKFSVYVISGCFAAAASILVMSRLLLATGNLGSGYELDAVAACVIGGASLMGGKGTAGKTIIGVFVLAFIGNIMNLLGVPAYPQDIVKGVIIIVAVLFQNSR